MHQTAHDLMADLLKRHTEPLAGKTVLDVGACDVNGTHRPLVEGMGGHYHGIDIAAGANVDIVVPEEGDWAMAGTADVVISGQCLEHVKKPWLWIAQVAGLVRPSGLCIVIVPWTWLYHPHPVDCWRVLPDGMRVLLDLAHLRVVDIGMKATECYGVARKPDVPN